MRIKMRSQFVSKQFKIHNLKFKEVKTLQELTRPNIWKLKPYSSARDEYKGVTASVFLDANENPYNTPHNRYPDPMQCELKTLLSKIKKVSPEHIFLGNGSDEAIDLVFRAFCEPGKDNVVAIDPTYGMYQVCADVNDVEYRKVLLDDDFQFSADKLLAATDEHTKLIFLCSPNNPTGNDLLKHVVEKAKTGRDVTSTVSIQVQSHINICFFGCTTYFRFPFSGKKELGYLIPVSCCKSADFFQSFFFQGFR